MDSAHANRNRTADQRNNLEFSLTRFFLEIIPCAILPEMVATVDT